MNFEPVPRIGDWYKNMSGEAFEVIAQDEDDETLELQYYDGTLEELDPETWEAMHPVPIEPPEDWTGSMDVTREDSLTPDTLPETDDWMSAIERIDQGLD